MWTARKPDVNPSLLAGVICTQPHMTSAHEERNMSPYYPPQTTKCTFITSISRNIGPVRCWAKGLRGTSILVTWTIVWWWHIPLGWLGWLGCGSWMWLVNHDDLLMAWIQILNYVNHIWFPNIGHLRLGSPWSPPSHWDLQLAAGLMKLRRSLFDIASQVDQVLKPWWLEIPSRNPQDVLYISIPYNAIWLNDSLSWKVNSDISLLQHSGNSWACLNIWETSPKT